MSPLKPSLHRVKALVATPSGWFRGTFHVPGVQGFLTYLNHQEEVLKLTEAILPGSKEPHPFLAIHKSATSLILPLEGLDPLNPGPANAAQDLRLVTCLLPQGSIRGHLELPQALRTSDFLMRKPGFVAFRRCYISPNPYLPPQEITDQAFPLIFLNTHSLVATTEEVEIPVRTRDA